MSTVAGLPIDRVELNVPLRGAWHADMTLTSGAPPTGQVHLVIGELDMLGTVLDDQAGNDAPDRPHLTVVGAPGWDRLLLRPLSYRADSGVRLASVLADLATLAGEPIEQPTSRSIGTSFCAVASSTRAVVRLRDVLATMQRSGHVEPWRVDPDGVTRFGDRVGVEVSSRAIEMSRNAAVGMRRVGIDDPSDFLPGNTLGGTTIQRLVVREREDAREALIWQ